MYNTGAELGVTSGISPVEGQANLVKSHLGSGFEEKNQFLNEVLCPQLWRP